MDLFSQVFHKFFLKLITEILILDRFFEMVNLGTCERQNLLQNTLTDVGGGDVWKKYENLTSQEDNNLSLKSKIFKKHLYHNNKLAVPKIIKFKSSTIRSF